jgi:hypothetical protein
MGKIIAILFLIGGAAVIRSLMTSSVNMIILAAGCIILLTALVLFIRQLKKIQ